MSNFSKTTVVIDGVVPEQGVTIQALLENFKQTAKDRGITDIWIDPGITRWFEGVEVSRLVADPSRLLRFVNEITHAKIVEECNKLNAYQEFDLSDGIQRATALVATGEIDQKNNRGVIIYLTNRRDGIPCRLFVWRREDGQLILRVRKAYRTNQWRIGHGTLVRNKSLGE